MPDSFTSRANHLKAQFLLFFSLLKTQMESAGLSLGRGSWDPNKSSLSCGRAAVQRSSSLSCYELQFFCDEGAESLNHIC